MRALHVHIGWHKTGSTALQWFMRENATGFWSRDVAVPSAGTTGFRSGHHNIAWELRGDPRFRPRLGRLADLLEEVEPARSALVSSESFSHLVHHPGVLKELRESVAERGWQLHYIWFHRRRDAYFVAMQREMRKHGKGRPFPLALLEARTKGTLSGADERWWLDHREFHQRWAGELDPCDYDSARGDLPAALCRMVGLSPFGTPPPRLNRTRLSAPQRWIAARALAPTPCGQGGQLATRRVMGGR